MSKTRSTATCPNDDMDNMTTKTIETILNNLTFIEQLANKIAEQLKETAAAIDNLEQYGRRRNLRIFGVPENKNKSVEDTVIEVFKYKLNIALPNYSIDVVHRLPSKEGKRSSIMVRFTQMSMLNLIYNNKTKLKGTNIVIKEDLTKKRTMLMKEALVYWVLETYEREWK
ncbi:hypothetical protein RN001_003527 [Aquatica leii]|uniref:Transposase n=1 Tax=Aquatica leii TaxID=1421715 RepID=A0AAN7PR72_9COLE|nr:hypothetical protein RN001_003527 [Aquatica leii]